VPAILAVVVFFTSLLEHVNAVISGSLALSVAISCLVALLLTAVLVFALLRTRWARGSEARAARMGAPGSQTGEVQTAEVQTAEVRAAQAGAAQAGAAQAGAAQVRDTELAAAGTPADEGRQARQELGLNVALTIGWCAAGISLVAILGGYIALANFVAKQTVWAAFVLSALYLLLRLTDDLITTALASRGRAGVELHDRFGVAPRRIDQAAVLLSGGLRVALVILAVVALATPYGGGPGDLLERQLSGASRGIAIGELVLSPGTLLRGFLVLVLAILVFRRLQRWFEQRYLPTTLLEPGMQSSLASLVGYAGVVVAVAMSLTAIGVGLERITWIASALSVGIGFGLQAIVQNFVSGLILLAERPVNVGDWVIVGDAEGDVRRINVRATEIRTGDRTTVLVPNSELITKVVRNRTRSNAEGLVKVLLPMPLTTDVDVTRALILEVLNSHHAILKDPAPAVLLDDLSAGRMVFNASAFVVSPRAAYGVRSEILFEIVRRLQGAGIPMYEPPAIPSKP
jgi:small-conductance mechanosensitive channel